MRWASVRAYTTVTAVTSVLPQNSPRITYTLDAGRQLQRRVCVEAGRERAAPPREAASGQGARDREMTRRAPRRSGPARAVPRGPNQFGRGRNDSACESTRVDAGRFGVCELFWTRVTQVAGSNFHKVIRDSARGNIRNGRLLLSITSCNG